MQTHNTASCKRWCWLLVQPRCNQLLLYACISSQTNAAAAAVMAETQLQQAAAAATTTG
jgi:hypothetical protein